MSSWKVTYDTDFEEGCHCRNFDLFIEMFYSLLKSMPFCRKDILSLLFVVYSTNNRSFFFFQIYNLIMK